MLDWGALLVAVQPMADAGVLSNLSLNAGAVAPEGAILLALLLTLTF